MDFLTWITGLVQLELVSARLDRTIILLNAEEIELFGFQQIDFLTCRFWVRRKNLSNALKICRYLDGNVKIISRKGIYWTINRLRARPVLIIGLSALLAFYWIVPRFVFFVKVEGNVNTPSRLILAEAENCGIQFGACREAVRSERVKNQLLERIPQLQWAGINTVGCVATISVREKQPKQDLLVSGMVSSLHASSDGYILSATATKGTLLVQPGQTVKAGQMLISGLTDCGICIRAEQAEGEVYAQTNRRLEAKMLPCPTQNIPTGKTCKKYSLIIGKKRINLWKDSGNFIDSCGRMYEEYYVTLPGDFSLPAALCIETWIVYERMPMQHEEQNLYPEISSAAKSYVNSQMAAGNIIHESETFTVEENTLVLTADYLCQEMISRIRQEQIGEINGEDD